MSALTVEQKGDKIAKALGYIYHRTPIGGYSTANWQSPNGFYCRTRPDYFGDLNACHEMEEMLLARMTAQQKSDWEWHIRRITLRDAADGTGLYERIIRANAPQRCEAFGLTLGLWEAGQ